MNDDTSIKSEADGKLLQHYADSASVPAFEELVRRHLNHVFSAALRRVNGDHALAKDVTQTVFVDLARKAGRIPADMPPGGWLHRHTGFVASKMIDKERRRRAREQEAATMNTTQLSTAPDPEWSTTAPLLDAAMDTLPDSDRNAIVLRFFEQKDFRSVGEVLGMSDDAAQKKVSRAVEKLRGLLGRRGLTSSGGALAGLMLSNSVQAAPSALVTQISTQSLAGAATAAGGDTLVEALSALGTAARIKAAAALVSLVALAGFAGNKILQPEIPVSLIAPSAVPAGPTGAGATSPAAVVQAPVPPPIARQMSLAELIAAAAAEWRGGRENVGSTSKALGWIAQINPAQMPEALEIGLAIKDEPGRLLVMKYLLRHWAESEPRKAMAWASSDAAGVHRADLAEGVMNAWAGNNPEAVMGFAGKTGTAFHNVPLNDSAVATVFRTMAKNDPTRALLRLDMIPNSMRGPALRGIFDTVQTETQREAIAGLIGKIRNDDTRIQARRAMVEQWARRNAVAAAVYVERAEPAWERTRLMDSLGFTWLQSEPALAAAWWVDHAPGPDTLVKIINIWAQRDPNAAAEWLGKQAAGPNSDAARMTFSRQVADLDPISALRWAETVTDNKMREDTIDHVFGNWRVRNADEANAFLHNAGWPSGRVERLLNNPNPK